MCGIAGIFQPNGKPISIMTLKKMTDAIRHRGPDGEGFWTDSFVGLGHRRLAIIDLSAAGHQPMQTENGRYVISYNGEIYNFLNLRIELESKGYQFHSRTDTEVVLKGYQEWGIEVLEKLNGMFAFAIWDRVEHQLMLARDRFGVKPLYYYFKNGTLLFGSEIKSFMEHPEFEVKVSMSALSEYFAFQNSFSSQTLFEGVKILEPGHFITVKLGDSHLSSSKNFWNFNFSQDSRITEQDAVSETYRLFEQAVQRQLLSDVEVGSYLSGGMDSGSVAAIAAVNHPNLKTFTCGFDLSSASGLELNFDERARAEVLSNRFKTEQYEIVLKAGDMERIMPNLMWHLEDPRIGQCYPNFYIARLASKFVKVALCGTGGDEVFGGYPWRYYRAMYEKSGSAFIEKYYEFWQRLVPATCRPSFFKAGLRKDENFKIFKDIFLPSQLENISPEELAQTCFYFEAKTFLHGLLVVEDKVSMAHGLETRVPFLDNDLVSFAQTIPVHLKLRNLTGSTSGSAHLETSDGKLVLRSALSKILPPEYTTGVKQGFSAPDASWFKGPSIEYIKNLLEDPRARIYDYLDYKTVTDLMNQHFKGIENRRLLIWSLLSFEWWNRVFIK